MLNPSLLSLTVNFEVPVFVGIITCRPCAGSDHELHYSSFAILCDPVWGASPVLHPFPSCSGITRRTTSFQTPTHIRFTPLAITSHAPDMLLQDIDLVIARRHGLLNRIRSCLGDWWLFTPFSIAIAFRLHSATGATFNIWSRAHIQHRFHSDIWESSFGLSSFRSIFGTRSNLH